MRKILVAAAVILSINYAHAFRLQFGRTVTISQPVYENLYVAAGTIIINAPVYGDLIIAGGNITINDTIQNDILLVGGNVVINGYVGGDIRCAGGELHIMKSMNGDLAITGGSVLVDKDVTIGGGLLVSGGDIKFNGTVKQYVRAYTGKLELNGIAESNIDCRGGKIEINGIVRGYSTLAGQQITIGSKAAFFNDVRYWSRNKSHFGRSVQNGRLIFDESLKIRTGRWYYLGSSTVLGLLWYLGMALLMIGLIEYLFASTLRRSAEQFYSKTIKSLGAGLLFFVGVPLSAVILLITMIGLPLGLLLLAGYVVLIFLAISITSLVIAHLLKNRFKYHWSFWQIAFAALAVFVLLKIVMMTPFMGWLILCVLALVAFGSILLSVKWPWKMKRSVA